MIKIRIIFCLLIALTTGLQAQDKPRFYDDVQTIVKFDKMYAPPENPILFIGSSSIRKWDDLEITFAKYVAMNRGIGGAITTDIIRYAPDIIFPYNPREIVIYVGENDLVEKGVTADSMLLRFDRLYTLIRSRLPAIPIVYISIKPSPSRAQYFSMAREANALIKEYIGNQKNISFVNIYDDMLDREKQPRKELFVDDMLHMNKKGYEIWRKALQPYLLKK
ncbi:MAG TPA: GDSL-type esterase/lipase family protein [Chitinophaga sp.]|nr:GDSL-type esterase/lipase family protein [Chitinophaga sp.]